MIGIQRLVRIAGLFAVVVWAGSQSVPAAALPSIGLQGKVKSADGKPLEGVTVSARAEGKTMTTSVYTNTDGEYYFPALDDGPYHIWAQAVGFQKAVADQTISSGKKIQQDLTMRPISDFHMQLSATEWVANLPGDSPEDRRMRDAFHNNCTMCHLAGFVLSKRFDASGWATILDTMLKYKIQEGSPIYKLVSFYKDDLVGYLGRVRGADASVMKLKAFPRLTGESDAVVVTEYDVPRGDDPKFVPTPNGSDWSEGIGSTSEGEVLHDAAVGKDGYIYFSDNSTPERTIGRLDPKTGEIKGFKFADKEGLAVRTHGVIVDQAGNVWFTNGTDGTMIKFDPKAEKFQPFAKSAGQSGRVGGGIDVDSKGILWSSANIGSIRLDPKTGQYTDYQSITKGGSPYGIVVDAEDNAWVAQLGADKLMVVNGKNGEVGEVGLAPLPGVSPKDMEIGRAVGGSTSAGPLYFKGPRRLWADKSGDTVWVAEFWADQIAKVDIHTRKVTEYKVPYRYSHPYAIVVDKNHMVWICLKSSDRVAKFNPFTEQFTEYPLPSLGTDARRLDIDNSTNPPTLWIPYTGINKIARMEFRTTPGAMRASAPQSEAQSARVQ
jgi:virginiamycin B lyase